ncbi:MAG: hypothetical protein JSU65_14775 [Candidatus Zixiibacteriota bacterium]|nr:MAG: hypothetical protein JSU65_14775 [candidate division Zixibacteria bacterium]
MRSKLLAITLFLAGQVAAGEGPIDQGLIDDFRADFRQVANATSVINAICNNQVNDLALNRERMIDHDKLFTFRLESAGVTNQRSSGRCWLFAGMNIYSPGVMTKLKLGSFEFSHSYLAFWDKMEKANSFLETMIELRDAPIDDRKLEAYLQSPFGDGGWWNYVTNLIEKYGVVPASAMPETKQSTSTGTVNRFANRKLRMFALELRGMHQDGKKVKDLRERKEEMLSEIYQLMAFHYGEPPSEFDFRYKPKGDSAQVQPPATYTPQTFRNEFIGEELPEYVAILNDPGREFDQPFVLEGASNMYGQPDLAVLNLPIERLKEYTTAALYDSQAVWFACDVGKGHFRDSGLLVADIYDYEGVLGLDLSMSKEDQLAYFESTTGHAMIFMGVDTSTTGETVKWLVENSWGKDKGDDGFWYMYDGWFDEYVYMVIIDRRLIDEKDLRNLEKTPEVIPIWSPVARAMR